MRLMVPEEPVFAFVSGQPAILPRPEELVSQVLEWLAAQGLARPERPYQMDEEVEVTAQSGEAAVPPKAKGRSPRAGRDGATFSGKASTAKPKRVTTASLAQSLEEVLTTLPALSSQVQLLVDRQSTLEKRLVDASSVPKQLAQPLSATVALSKQGAVVDAAKLLRSPPRDDWDSFEPAFDSGASCRTSAPSRAGGRIRKNSQRPRLPQLQEQCLPSLQRLLSWCLI